MDLSSDRLIGVINCQLTYADTVTALTPNLFRIVPSEAAFNPGNQLCRATTSLLVTIIKVNP